MLLYFIVVFLIPGIYSEKAVNSSLIKKYLSFNPSSALKDVGLHLMLDGSECGRDFRLYIKKLMDGEEWALSMLDATSKIQSGILKGNIYDLGAYDECVDIDVNVEQNNKSHPRNIKGKYCLGSIPVPDDFILSQKIGFRPESQLKMRWSICVPHTCRAKKLNEYFNIIMKKINVTITFYDESCLLKDNPVNRLNRVDIAAICLAVIFLVILIGSTLYDRHLKQQNIDLKNHPLVVFSITRNLKDLFTINDNKNKGGVLTSMIGLRSLSMGWIVYGHCLFVTALFPLQNYIDAEEFARSLPGQMVLGSSITVDTFLVMSGALASYNFMSQYKRGIRLSNIPFIYFMRYMRLTPALAAVILFQVSLSKFCGSGPLYTEMFLRQGRKCLKYWYSALLYVQNYVNPNQICVGQTWYLSVDTQLYFIAPFLAMIFYRYRKSTYPALLFLSLLSAVSVFVTTFIFELNASLAEGTPSVLKRRESLVYVPTHSRAAPWLLGMALGYFLHDTKDKKIVIKPVIVYCGWILCSVILLAVPLGLYPFMQREHIFNKIEDPTYASFHRFGWALAIIWIIVTCENGYGGIVGKILSYPLFQPLSRLSYSQYLIHMFFQTSVYGSIRSPFYYTYFLMFPQFISDYVFTLAFAVVLCITFESPVVRLAKIYFSPKKKTENEKNDNEKNENEKNDKVNEKHENFESNIINFGKFNDKQFEVTKF